MNESNESKQPLILPLNIDKVYIIYYGNNGWVVGKFIETVNSGGGVLLKINQLSDGFGHQKHHFINPAYVTDIIEFDSYDEYKKHFDDWKEDEKLRKFKND
ncbi:MAG TPA: hypothetical protein PLO78_07910 [Candidatus Omnitrophota bacterium]|nr:hypothetical protein [Candidatus Omnitrophota bacterium]